MVQKLLGQYLVGGNLITPEELQRALDLQVLQLPGTDARLGTMLVQLGSLGEQQIEAMLEQQQRERAGTA